MIWKCKCGATKSTQPWKSAICKEFMCDKCAGEGRFKPRVREPKVTVTKVSFFERRTKHKVFNVG